MYILHNYYELFVDESPVLWYNNWKKEGVFVRDLPLFQTPYGIAGLVLREVPYQKTAYVHIQATDAPKQLLEECIGFCRAVGAEQVYAKGHLYLQQFPLHTTIMKMTCPKHILSGTDAYLVPVIQDTLEQWRQIYLKKISSVPNAAWMSKKDAEEMLSRREGYFIYKDGRLLGIGQLKVNEIAWLASVEKGAGADVVCALAAQVAAEEINLCVSADNTKAMSLYQRLGFVVTEELSSWYKIF